MSVITFDLGPIRAAIKSTTGMDLSGIKDQQLDRRITSFCQRRGITSTDDLVKAIRSDKVLLAEFVDRLTINVTNLYRNPERWADLEGRILPELGARPKIWSAGCSTGAEAYSLAIATVRTGGTPSVLGSDIDRASLDKARSGRYNAEDMRELPAEIERKWFRKDGSDWVVDPAIARHVRFERRDLLNDAPPSTAFDLVACRNVVIYFNDEAKDRLHATLAASLRPGGYLFVGNAERVNRPADLQLVAAGPQFYRKAE
jgi:chemotaxis protein methyltransferase CheR